MSQITAVRLLQRTTTRLLEVTASKLFQEELKDILQTDFQLQIVLPPRYTNRPRM